MPLAERESRYGERSTELTQAQEWLAEAERSTPETSFRYTAIEDYKFYAGDQDSIEVKDALSKQNRPCTVFNEVKPKIDMLVGLAAQTKHEANVLPVSGEDQALAELAMHALNFFRKKLGIASREVNCFEHTVKCGRSMLYYYVDVLNPFKPEIKCKRIRYNHFYIDPDSIELDLSDARYIFVENWVTEDEIKGRWPGIDISNLSKAGQTGEVTYFNEANNKYRLVECWHRKFISVVYFINPLTGKDEWLKPEEFKDFQNSLLEGLELPGGQIFQTDEPVQGYPSVKEEIYYIIYSGDVEFAKGKSPYFMERFPGVLYGAYKEEDSNAWFSVVSMMKDPQRTSNTLKRQLSHLLQTLPKGILMHEAGSILNIEEYEDRSAEPNFHLELAPGKIDTVRFQTQPPISPIYSQFDQICTQAMKDVSGIQNDLMGIQTTSREPGISVRIRKETALAVLYSLFDNFQKSRLAGNKILLSLIQQYIKEPILFRIEGQEGMQLAQLNTQMNQQVTGFNDISSLEYDMLVDENIETSSMKMTIAQILADFAQNNPGTIPPDIILDYSDVPFSAKQKVKQFQQMTQEQEQRNIEADQQIKFEEMETKKEIARINAGARERKETKKEERKKEK